MTKKPALKKIPAKQKAAPEPKKIYSESEEKLLKAIKPKIGEFDDLEEDVQDDFELDLEKDEQDRVDDEIFEEDAKEDDDFLEDQQEDEDFDSNFDD